MSIETEWLAGKAEAKADLEAALGAGIPLEMAKRIARWNPTYEYDTFNDMQTIGLPAHKGTLEGVILLVSRSGERTGAGLLEGAVLDAGKLYAIWVSDVPELAITSVQFLLDGVPVHNEGSAPWDYDGTMFDGSASRVTFVPGNYEIEAGINPGFGPGFLITAAFSVE